MKMTCVFSESPTAVTRGAPFKKFMGGFQNF